MASKHRVRISGTIGKSIRVGETRPILGINVDHPAGGTPTLEQWKEIFCCVQPVPENPIWEWPNLSQLARLTCCGIIVRRCTPGEESVTYSPLDTFAEEFQVNHLDSEHQYVGRGRAVTKRSNGTFIERTMRYTGGGVDIVTTAGSPDSVEYGSRVFDGGGNIVTPFAFTPVNVWTSGGATFVGQPIRGSENLYVLQRKGFGEVRWLVNGSVSGVDLVFPYADSIANSSTNLFSDGGALAAPGQGLYLLAPGSSGFLNSVVIARYEYTSDGAFPAATPSSWLDITDRAPAGAGVFHLTETRILGRDSDGNVYIVWQVSQTGAFSRLLKLDGALTTVLADIQLFQQELDSPSYYALLADGGILLRARNPGGSAAPFVSLYDISDDATLTLITTRDIGTPATAASWPTPVEGVSEVQVHFTGSSLFGADINDAVWSFLDEISVSERPTSQFACLTLTAAGGAESRITIENPAGQAGDPIFDLREIEQGSGGTLLAVTVDAWGRVVESRPVTSADIEAIYSGTVPDTDTGTALDSTVVFDGGRSDTSYADYTLRVGDEGDSTVQYGVGVADFDERGSEGVADVVDGGIDPGGVWSPANLLPAMWYDASDDAAVDLVGTQVERLLDKSLNARHLSPSTETGVVAPVRVDADLGKAIRFGLDGGITTLRTGVISVPSASAGISIALVAKDGTVAGGNSVHWLFSQTAATLSYNLALYVPNAAAGSLDNAAVWNAYVPAGGGSSSRPVTATDDLPDPRAPMLWAGNISTAIMEQFIDGTAAGGTRSDITTLGGSGRFYLGGRQEGSVGVFTVPLQWTGDLYEIVVVYGVLSLANRQRLEGYLAHKWGIGDNLPGGHPFKAAPPA